MEKIVFKPICKKVNYQFNPETGYYQKSATQPERYAVAAMPYELKREQTRATQIMCNAAELLTIRERKKENGSRKLLTGLQPTHFANWYYGNHCRMLNGNKYLSDILFHFSTDNSLMTAYFFSGYHKDTKELRMQFASHIIPQLLK